MVKGDPNLERLYQWSNTEQTMSMRGAAGGGEGVHILTGPVYVCGAEPGTAHPWQSCPFGWSLEIVN
jgi:hypothetical protein